MDVWDNLHNSLSRFRATDAYYSLQAQKMKEIKKQMKRKDNEKKQKEMQQEREKEKEFDKNEYKQKEKENGTTEVHGAANTLEKLENMLESA